MSETAREQRIEVLEQQMRLLEDALIANVSTLTANLGLVRGSAPDDAIVRGENAAREIWDKLHPDKPFPARQFRTTYEEYPAPKRKWSLFG